MKKVKLKKEYIPVYISVLILVLFAILLVLTISYQGKKGKENEGNSTNAVNEDLAISKKDSKCSQDELSELVNIAGKISGDYRVTTRKVPLEPDADPSYAADFPDGYDYTYIEITIKGLTEGVYVQIVNDFNNDVKTIKFSDLDENGEYKYEAPNMDKIITYTINVYADKYNCAGEVIRKVSFETKMYNTWSDTLACLMYPKYNNCVKVVDKAISNDDFNKGLEEYKNGNKKHEDEANANLFNAFHNTTIFNSDNYTGKEEGVPKKVFNSIKENIELIIIACVTIGIGILVVILIMFIRRNRL